MVTAIQIEITTKGNEPVPARDKEGSSEQTECKEKLQGVKSDTTVFMQNGLNLDHAALLQENQESQERKGKVQRNRRKGQENHWKTSKPLTHETISFTYEGAHRYNEEEESMGMGAVEGMKEKEVQEKRRLPSAPGNEKGKRQLFDGEGNSRFDILVDVATMICNGTLSLPELDSDILA